MSWRKWIALQAVLAGVSCGNGQFDPFGERRTTSTPDAWRAESTAAQAAEGAVSISFRTACDGRSIDPRVIGASTGNFDLTQQDYEQFAAARLSDMMAGSLRFPGGESADNYVWELNDCDDPTLRPGKDGVCPDLQDTESFLVEVAKLGADPIFVVNLDGAFVRWHEGRCGSFEDCMEALGGSAKAWVEATTTAEGALRVRRWEIGNEQFWEGPRVWRDDDGAHKVQVPAALYARAFAIVARRMHEASDQIAIGAVGPRSPTRVAWPDAPDQSDTNDQWWPTFMANPDAKARLGFVSVHIYSSSFFRQTSTQACDDYRDCNGGHGKCHEVDTGGRYCAYSNLTRDGDPPFVDELSELRQYLNEQMNGPVEVVATEWNLNNQFANVWSHREHLVAVSMMLGAFMELGLSRTQYWPVTTGLENSTGLDWGHVLFSKETGEPWPTAVLFEQWGHHLKSRLLAVEQNSAPSAVAALGMCNSSQDLAIVLTNKTGEPREVTVSGLPDGGYRLTTLLADDGPRYLGQIEVGQQSETLSASAGTITVTLAPESVSFVAPTGYQASLVSQEFPARPVPLSYPRARQAPALGIYDPANLDFRFEHRPSQAFGQLGDVPLVRRTGNDITLGVYRPSSRMFYFDVTADGDWDNGRTQKGPFGRTSDVGLFGDWDGDGDGDVGVFRPSERRFYLDMNDDGRWDGGDVALGPFGHSDDIPIVGDWNGDGADQIGTYRPSDRRFYLDHNADGVWGAGDRALGPFGQFGDRPLAGDWTGSGRDNIGVYRPDTRTFYLDVTGDGVWSAGDRVRGPFGNPGDDPIVGDWTGNGVDQVGVYRSATGRVGLDRNGDGSWGSDDLHGGVLAGGHALAGDWDGDGDDELVIRVMDEQAFVVGLGPLGIDSRDAIAGPYQASDVTLVGDWDGDGQDDFGIYRPQTRQFCLDTRQPSGQTDCFGPFGQHGDRPLVGDWNGDGRDNIGVHRPGERMFCLDLDGDGSWGSNDRCHVFGAATDTPVAGDWDGSGYDRIGVYRRSERTFWVDLDGNGQWTQDDRSFGPFGQAADVALVGDWDGSGVTRIGVYRPSNGRFYLDIDGEGTWTSDDAIVGPLSDAAGTPLIGDFNRDGKDQIALRTAQHAVLVDVNGNGVFEPGDVALGPFGQPGDYPLLGDWTGDGHQQIGVYRPRERSFYLDIDGDGAWSAEDRRLGPFGSEGDVPLAGDWNGDQRSQIAVYRPNDQTFYLDYNGDGQWSGSDVVRGPFGLPGDRPLVGDWNQDGRDEIGIYRPGNGVFALDMNGTGQWDSGDRQHSPFALCPPEPGDYVAGRFVFRNSGTTTWSSDDVRLRLWQPWRATGWHNAQRVPWPVPPGSTVAMWGRARLSQPGQFVPRWRMVKQETAWFGPLTEQSAIFVGCNGATGCDDGTCGAP